ncbi:hypothetical protein [Corynebacterium ammoniagenes]|nr:hypothetical protein [Corynebacterium ammoniagenes]
MIPIDYTEENTKFVPFRRVMKAPKNATLQWVALVHGFKLGNYTNQFPFRIELEKQQLDNLQQYVDRCSAVAQCDPLWSGYSSTWVSNRERPQGQDFKIISDHDMRSVCLTFRQLYSNDEPGMTFRNVNNLIQKISRNQLEPQEFEQLNQTFLKPLLTAAKELQTEYFDDIFIERVLPSLTARSPPPRERDKNEIDPEKIISILFYGGYVHAGKHTETFELLKSEPARFHQLRYQFIGQVRAFSLIYLSFGEMILALARGNGLVRPIYRTDHQTNFSFDG